MNVTESDADQHGERDSLDEDRDQAQQASWLALFYFTSRLHIVTLLFALFLSIASGMIIPALAVFLGKIFDVFTTFGANEISGPDLVKKVSGYAIALVGLGSASGILNALFFGLWLSFGELQAKSVREKLYDSMLEKDMEWYDMRNAGIETLVSRQHMQIRELQLATSQPIGFAVQYTITTLTALGLAFYYCWSLTFVTLATVPVAGVFFAWISKQMEPSIEAQNQELTKASNIVSNALLAIDTVKYFNGQEQERWNYATAIRKAASHYLSEAQANAAQAGFTRFITMTMFVQGFWYGSHLVNTGKKNPGEILTTFWACLMAMQSYEQIVPQIVVLLKGKVAGATLKAMIVRMENGRHITQMVGRKAPLHCAGRIEVCNVSFAYPSRPDQVALKNGSFLFPAGETTFIVGRSGSGKSTLGNLLMRFYEPDSGDLLIDGNPIQTLDIKWLRSNITLVQQQSVLFNETLFKNIAFGCKDHTRVTKEEVERAIETALLQLTIGDLPKGLNTVLGAGGNFMSGGQKQRVAIARARLRNTPVLILDEATSALDQVSKCLIMSAIREWRHGKTTIIITHDMSQVEDKDYAYVLEEGAIIQQGFRESLEKSARGPFKELWSPIFDSPMTIQRPSAPLQSPRMMHTEEPHESPPLKSPVDSMNMRFQYRKSRMPAIFKPLPEIPVSRRPSQQYISPLPPAAFPMHRGSIHTSMLDRQQRRDWRGYKLPDSIEIPSLPSPQSIPTTRNESIETAVMNQGIALRRLKSTLPRRLSRRRSATSATVLDASITDENVPSAESQFYVAPLKNILGTIWPTLNWRNRLVLIVGFVAATIHAAATPVFSFIFAKLLSTFYLADSSQRSHHALVWSLSVLGVAGMDAAASYSMHYLLEYCGQTWVDSTRKEAMLRILDQPRSWFDDDRNNLTLLTECLDRNAEEMRNLLGRFAGYVYVAVVMTAVAITWSLTLSWKLTLVGLASGPYIYAVTRAFESVSGRWEDKSNEAGASTNGIFNETFSNIRTVRALTLETYFHEKYTKAVSRTLVVGLKRSTYSGLFFGLSDSGVIFATALIFYYGAILASDHHYSTSSILTVFTMLLFSISNVNAMVSFVPQINSSRTTATHLLRLAHLPHKSSHEYTGHVRLRTLGTIDFKKVNFTYPSRHTNTTSAPAAAPILNALTLTISPATTTALVGASGSGKSTIASLLLNLQPPSSGAIKINNIPLSTLHTETLRSFISIVPQQPTLFPASVAQNIAYALPEYSPLASLPSVRAAAQASGIHDFITSLPSGYATLIGDGGTGLSGGQAQRIAIARALVRRPKLLILDEATSGLDGETAKGVRNTIVALSKRGVGVLAITHDKAMMKVCEDVVVIKEGRVCERGGFVELRRRKGELARLLGEG